MSTSDITIAIVGVILVSIFAIWLVQSRERARVEQIRKLNACRERHRHLQQLLHELPPQYLTNELRIMILERSIDTLNELVRLKPDPKTNSALKQDQDMLKNIREKNPKFKPVQIQDENAAKDVRKLLDILYKFVQTQHKRKKLDAINAKKYMDQIIFSASQSKADLFVARAKAANEKGKPRVAIHNYHNAIEAFKNNANHPLAVQAVTEYRAQIKALEEVADEKNKQLKAETQKKLEGSDEWNEFLGGDDDQWKKKNAYDD